MSREGQPANPQSDFGPHGNVVYTASRTYVLKPTIDVRVISGVMCVTAKQHTGKLRMHFFIDERSFCTLVHETSWTWSSAT